MTTHSSTISLYPDLRGKVALVTGGSRGIGAATCRAWPPAARKWPSTVATRRRSRPWSPRSGTPAAAMAAPADCANLADTRRMAGELRQAWGEPDLLAARRRRHGPAAAAGRDQRAGLALQPRQQPDVHVLHAAMLPAGHDGARRGQRGDDGLGRRPRGLGRAGRLRRGQGWGHHADAACRRGSGAGGRAGQLPVAVGGADRADRLAHAGCAASRHAAGVSAGAPGETDDVAAAALFLLSSASGWITGVTLDVAGEGDGLRGRGCRGKGRRRWPGE